MIAISEAQRSNAPDLPWAATVHNAIRASTFPFRADKEPFVLFLGRMNTTKGPHLAIDAARAAGLPIVLAGKCSEPVEKAYFEREIKPRLGSDVEIFGVADRNGSLERGRPADLVLWSGDPLEVTTLADAVFIQGVPQPMRSRQTELRDRYLTKLRAHAAR